MGNLISESWAILVENSIVLKTAMQRVFLAAKLKQWNWTTTASIIIVFKNNTIFDINNQIWSEKAAQV